MTMHNPADTPLCHSVADAARLIGISRSRLYQLIVSGELTVARIGCRTLVPHDELVRLLDAGRGRPLGKSPNPAVAAVAA